MTPNHIEANVTRWIDGSVGQPGDESSSGAVSVALEYQTAVAVAGYLFSSNLGIRPKDGECRYR